MSQQLNERENAVMGLLTGAIEVATLQPLNYWKCASQQKLPFTINPRVLYRGFPSNLTNMAGCTMWQFTVCGFLKNQILQGEDRQLTLKEELMAGLGAGASSAVVGSPLELVMIQQQRKGGSIPTRLRSLLGPQIVRGFTMSASREALWTVGFLSLPSVIRTNLMQNYPDVFKSEDQARVVASLGGAFVACFASQPFDTIKTCMQGDIERKTYGGVVDTLRHLYRDTGLGAFYRGTHWRYSRQVLAIFIMDKVRVELSPVVFPDKFQKAN